MLKPTELNISELKLLLKFLFLINHASIKNLRSMSDLFLVYCHIKHYFEKNEVINYLSM